MWLHVQDALLAEGAVQELVACIVRGADRPVAEYAASALLVLSHNHPGKPCTIFTWHSRDCQLLQDNDRHIPVHHFC